MLKRIVLLVAISLLFNSCSQHKSEKITIVVNSWIGYSPLFYAHEKGWLSENGINLINTVSLGESVYVYNAGSANAFTGTQHEFLKQRSSRPDLIPIILFDRSHGGDAILSNRSTEDLLASKNQIQVYLELDSINEELFAHYLKKYALSKERFKLFNRTQDEIVQMKASDFSTPVMIITYDPYNYQLVQQGFKQLADTRSDSDLIVIDALYVSSMLYQEHHERFIRLNGLIAKAIAALHNNPHEYYETVKPYLDNPTYSEFTHMMDNIQWIHRTYDSVLEKQLETINFPVKDLIR